MKLLEHKATYFGASPYADEAVLVMEFVLAEELAPRVDLLCQALHRAYPDWLTRPYDASLSPATRMATTIAQWALAALNAELGFLHEAGAAPTPTGAQLWVGFHEEMVSHAALQLALETLLHADRLHEREEKVRRGLDSLWQMCRMHHPNENSKMLMQAARANGIPYMPFARGTGTWQYGWGQRSRVFSGGVTNANGCVGQQLARSKIASKTAFAALGLPVAAHCLVTQPSQLERASRVTGWPCVTKPVDRGRGKGITAGIRNLAELETGFAYAQRYTQGPIMVETFVPGDDHRLMVLEGRLAATNCRKPASVVGDGKSTLAELLHALNASRATSKDAHLQLLQIQVDEVLYQQLARQGMELGTVPVAGQLVTLRSNANESTGGTLHDVSGMVHPQIRRAAEMIAEHLGLPTMGLDYITTDISRPWQEVGGAFIETNSNPGLGLMIDGCDLICQGERVLGNLPGRIPLTLAVAPQAEISAVQLWLQQLEWLPGSGWICGKVGCVDGVPLQSGGGDSWHAAEMILRHRSVGRALVVCGDQDLMQHGMHGGRADRVLLCNVGLPAQWLEGLSRNAGRLDHLPHWEGLAAHISND